MTGSFSGVSVTLLFPQCSECELAGTVSLNKLLCGYLWPLAVTPVRNMHAQTHYGAQRAHKAQGISVVFVPAELCLFKGGLVCDAEALNNN